MDGPRSSLRSASPALDAPTVPMTCRPGPLSILTCAILLIGSAVAVSAQPSLSSVVAGGAAFGGDRGSGSLFIGAALPLGSRFQARSGATWTSGRVTPTVEIAVDLEDDVSVFVPYAIGGVGVMLGGDATPGAVLGGGLRGRVDPRNELTIEVRGLWFDEPRAPAVVVSIGWIRALE